MDHSPSYAGLSLTERGHRRRLNMKCNKERREEVGRSQQTPAARPATLAATARACCPRAAGVWWRGRQAVSCCMYREWSSLSNPSVIFSKKNILKKLHNSETKIYYIMYLSILGNYKFTILFAEESEVCAALKVI